MQHSNIMISEYTRRWPAIKRQRVQAITDQDMHAAITRAIRDARKNYGVDGANVSNIFSFAEYCFQNKKRH